MDLNHLGPVSESGPSDIVDLGCKKFPLRHPQGTFSFLETTYNMAIMFRAKEAPKAAPKGTTSL